MEDLIPQVIELSPEDMEAFIQALESKDIVVSEKFLQYAETYKDGFKEVLEEEKNNGLESV